MNEKNQILVDLDKFQKAENGSILVKSANGWKLVKQDEYLKSMNDRLTELENLSIELRPLINANKHLLDEKVKNDKLIEKLFKVVSYLVYERYIDNGMIIANENERELLEKCLKGGKELPQAYIEVITKLMEEK